MDEGITRIGLDALAANAGRELACSGWFDVAQARIDAFAEASGDHQWIHVDVARARIESPYGTTIAHGFLTVSMLPVMIQSCLSVEGVAMAVNYGLDRVRFPAPVAAGSRIRARIALEAVEPVDGGVQARWLATVERDGGERPVCVARMLARYYRRHPRD